MATICYNGSFLNDSTPVINAADKSFRYGDGFFETMKIVDGCILLESLHRERITQSMAVLGYPTQKHFFVDVLLKNIIAVCQKNNCSGSARVRVAFSNGSGGLYDGSDKLNYLIEAWPLAHRHYEVNSNGLVIANFNAVKKAADAIAPVKTNSALLYAMAARFAATNRLNDALVLNTSNHIIESTIANLFWIKEDQLYTTPLSEGCIDGIMRKHIMAHTNVMEQVCTVNELQNATGIFLTNIIRGAQWVQTWEKKPFREPHTRYLSLINLINSLTIEK